MQKVFQVCHLPHSHKLAIFEIETKSSRLLHENLLTYQSSWQIHAIEWHIIASHFGFPHSAMKNNKWRDLPVADVCNAQHTHTLQIYMVEALRASF